MKRKIQYLTLATMMALSTVSGIQLQGKVTAADEELQTVEVSIPEFVGYFYKDTNPEVCYSCTPLVEVTTKTPELPEWEEIEAGVENGYTGVLISVVEQNAKAISSTEMTTSGGGAYAPCSLTEDLISELMNHLAGGEICSSITLFDFYEDGQINNKDCILAKRMYHSCPYNFVISNNGEKMDKEEFWQLFNYKVSEGLNTFTIRFGEQVPSETTTTTTAITETTTIATTTTSTTNWTQPAMEDLTHEGEQIDEETYNILINTAKMFNVDKYNIVWSAEPIDYAYTNPGSYYCMERGMAYGYGVQVIPGEEIDNLETGLSNWDASLFSVCEHMCYRPIVAEDSSEEVLASFEVNQEFAFKTDNNLIVAYMDDIIYPESANEGEEFETFTKENAANYFCISGWYLIPIDENGNEVLELAYPNEYVQVEDAGDVLQWFTHDEINPVGAPEVLRTDFYLFQETAEELEFASYKIVYNDSETDPIYYGFLPTNADISIIGVDDCCIQVVSGEDIAEIYPGLSGEKYYITSIDNVLFQDFGKYTDDIVIHTWDEDFDTFDYHYMIPLDENGEEILKIYYVE